MRAGRYMVAEPSADAHTDVADAASSQAASLAAQVRVRKLRLTQKVVRSLLSQFSELQSRGQQARGARLRERSSRSGTHGHRHTLSQAETDLKRLSKLLDSLARESRGATLPPRTANAAISCNRG